MVSKNRIFSSEAIKGLLLVALIIISSCGGQPPLTQRAAILPIDFPTRWEKVHLNSKGYYRTQDRNGDTEYSIMFVEDSTGAFMDENYPLGYGDRSKIDHIKVEYGQYHIFSRSEESQEVFEVLEIVPLDTLIGVFGAKSKYRSSRDTLVIAFPRFLKGLPLQIIDEKPEIDP